MSSFIFTLLDLHLSKHYSSQCTLECQEGKQFNMQLMWICQTVGRNSYSLEKALWQVHCGRTDSYLGGKGIVITSVFPMTLGWTPSDLLQEFWIGLPPLHPNSSQLSRLAGGDINHLFTGQELSHSEATHQSTNVWDLWSWATKLQAR